MDHHDSRMRVADYDYTLLHNELLRLAKWWWAKHRTDATNGAGDQYRPFVTAAERAIAQAIKEAEAAKPN